MKSLVCWKTSFFVLICLIIGSCCTCPKDCTYQVQFDSLIIGQRYFNSDIIRGNGMEFKVVAFTSSSGSSTTDGWAVSRTKGRLVGQVMKSGPTTQILILS